MPEPKDIMEPEYGPSGEEGEIAYVTLNYPERSNVVKVCRIPAPRGCRESAGKTAHSVMNPYGHGRQGLERR